MRVAFIIPCLFLCVCVIGNVKSQNQDIILSGPYLGEIPPTDEPKIFSSGFLSKDKVVGFTISPDGMEIYFCRFFSNNPKIMVTKRINDIWTKPELAQFSQDNFGGPPHISPDGKYLYWRTDKPFPDNWNGQKPQPGSREALQYWVLEKTEKDWRNAQPLRLPISLGVNLLGVSTTKDGTLYTSISFQFVRFQKQKNGYSQAEKLPQYLQGHSPAIAPDESFMVFVDGTPRKLFIAFRDEQNSWTQPRSLGDKINVRSMNGYPSITPDGKYLFYTANHKLYWVGTDMIRQYP